jgi:hypothetical protein
MSSGSRTSRPTSRSSTGGRSNKVEPVDVIINIEDEENKEQTEELKIVDEQEKPHIEIPNSNFDNPEVINEDGEQYEEGADGQLDDRRNSTSWWKSILGGKKTQARPIELLSFERMEELKMKSMCKWFLLD